MLDCAHDIYGIEIVVNPEDVKAVFFNRQAEELLDIAARSWVPEVEQP